MAQARLWSASPDRLCFHLLADGAALDALSSDGMARWALLSGWKLQELSQLQVVNASDARLAERVSRVGRRFLRSSLYTLRSKARKFTVAKLFLHHLLRDVDCALVLDSDIFVMADLCELWDLFENQLLSRPACLLGYAFEQQNEYRLWNKEASLPFRSLSEAQTPHAQGYNGGVALLALKRMRRHQEYEVTLARVLNFASTAYGACTPRAILRDICFRLMCNLKQLGDQTVLSLAARLNRQWHKHVWVIPCKWNWQTSLAFYTLGNQHRMTPACHRQVAPVLKTDSICPDPPLLLHFNYPTLLKDAHFHEFSLLKRGPEDYLRNEAILSRIFNQNVIVQRCNFSDYWVKISHRGCNSSFLLTRLREASQGGESPPPALLTRLREVASQRGGSLPLLPRAPLAGRRRPAPPPRSSKMQKICDPHPVGGRVLCGPALIMVGMAKCGTNAILTYLSRHPNVRVTGVKPVARSAPGGGIDLSQLDPAEFISKFGRGVAPADPNVWVINWFALEDDLKALRQSASTLLSRFPSAAVMVTMCDSVDHPFRWFRHLIENAWMCSPDGRVATSSQIDKEARSQFHLSLSDAFANISKVRARSLALCHSREELIAALPPVEALFRSYRGTSSFKCRNPSMVKNTTLLDEVLWGHWHYEYARNCGRDSYSRSREALLRLSNVPTTIASGTTTGASAEAMQDGRMPRPVARLLKVFAQAGYSIISTSKRRLREYPVLVAVYTEQWSAQSLPMMRLLIQDVLQLNFSQYSGSGRAKKFRAVYQTSKAVLSSTPEVPPRGVAWIGECCELLRMLDAWPPWTSCLPERTVDECASYPEIEPLGP